MNCVNIGLHGTTIKILWFIRTLFFWIVLTYLPWNSSKDKEQPIVDVEGVFRGVHAADPVNDFRRHGTNVFIVHRKGNAHPLQEIARFFSVTVLHICILHCNNHMQTYTYWGCKTTNMGLSINTNK